jgi:hypothetical protein
MSKSLSDFGEILTLKEAAELCGTSHVTFAKYVHSGKTPFEAEFKEGVHFYKKGRAFVFPKHVLAKLWKMID